MPSARRSRRRTRARQLGVPLDQLAQLGSALVPARPRPAAEAAANAVLTAGSGCCAARVRREVSSGGTVFVTRLHTGDCPVWSAR
jgi:hypothetical protein